MPVSVVTLDEFVTEQGITDVDLIKLDTERTEHDVLAGASKVLQRDRPDIICEEFQVQNKKIETGNLEPETWNPKPET